MNEMLGNQYFMARNYSAAQIHLQEFLNSHPDNKYAKRKIIVCYTQTGKMENAYNYFIELIDEDIEFIIDADPIYDDCPCQELVEQIENQSDLNRDSFDFQLMLGIIWLYCDVEKSASYFLKAKETNPDYPQIEYVYTKILNYINTKHHQQK
jgi:tetratricopeptide (TPR) repeat protein